METLPLTKTQQAIFDFVEDTDKNVFITGRPGTGKSVLTNALRQLGRKDYRVAAPTGLAALNVNGKTLHSMFRLPVSDGIIAPDYNKFSQIDNVVKFVRYQLRWLIIDEISMVRVDQFDFIDRFCRLVRNDSRPFGGIQVIAVGDFYQLPPVAKPDDVKALKAAGWESPFVFSSRLFEGFETRKLTEVLRQKWDRKFVDILARMRVGELTPKDLAAINGLVEPDFEDIRIRLVSTNAEAFSTNSKELAKLGGEIVTFSATQTGVWPVKDNFPAETELTLKVGAQVMVKLNKADIPQGERGDSDVVNGDLGIVEEIFDGQPDTEEGPGFDSEEPYVEVRLRKNDSVVKIWRRRWEYKVKEKIGNDWTERVVASFEQIPLSLAWAISMHKSQGQSFEAVHINCEKIFAPGQAYVAFSRCRTLEGITLESRVNASKFFANKEVVKFFKQLENV